jgi:hypothetical protein
MTCLQHFKRSTCEEKKNGSALAPEAPYNTDIKKYPTKEHVEAPKL